MKYILSLIAIAALLCTAAAAVDQKQQSGKTYFFVLSEECYQTLILDKNFFHIDCLKKTVSEIISVGIITLSVILKVPQILKIVQQSKVTGLSFHSIFNESLLYSFSIAYNVHKGNPFKLYGENVSILIQNIVISVLFKWYEGSFSKTRFLSHAFIFLGLNLPLFTGLVPNSVFDFAIYVNMALVAFARLPQIWLNFWNKTTGQLSFITVFLSFAGAAARCFTVLVSSSDILLLLLNVESLVLNFIVLFQMIIYWNSEKKTKKE